MAACSPNYLFLLPGGRSRTVKDCERQGTVQAGRGPSGEGGAIPAHIGRVHIIVVDVDPAEGRSRGERAAWLGKVGSAPPAPGPAFHTCPG